jgi:hypothetical protein
MHHMDVKPNTQQKDHFERPGEPKGRTVKQFIMKHRSTLDLVLVKIKQAPFACKIAEFQLNEARGGIGMAAMFKF